MDKSVKRPPETERYYGALVTDGIMGLAVGDALGVPWEFVNRDELRAKPVTAMRSGGIHNQIVGTWSDDTSLTVCLMESLMHGVDHTDQMKRFTDWMMFGACSAHGEVFDIGGTTKSAIFKYAQGYHPLECGGLAENSCGNGSLMRILPAALYLIGRHGTDITLNDETAGFIHNASRLTHAHNCCLMACGIYTSVVFALCSPEVCDISCALKRGVDAALEYYAGKRQFADQLDRFARLSGIAALPEDEISSDGYAVHTLEAALWCLMNTSSYAECALKAVNLGGDTDTTAAVAGSLAGLWYGADSIPKDWLSRLVKREYLEDCCRRFAVATFGCGV